MLTIHREPQPDKLIRMGHAPVILNPSAPKDEQVTVREFATAEEFLDAYNAEAAANIPDAPPEPVKNKQGRKKMAKDKDLEEVGTKTIRKDDAGEQGAVGSHGESAREARRGG